ncbi:MAG TPA: hypothetical protein VMW41_00830 [Candidatus Bathyarchaeia archaeon]|nr:hypothetical protein [Candidatus Bathyarchaeia archaeon]
MNLKRIVKSKKILIFLLASFLLVPLFTNLILAYDSTPDEDDVPYIKQVWLPAVKSSEMNLESFVYETIKAIPPSLISMILTNKRWADSWIIKGDVTPYKIPKPSEAGILQSLLGFITYLYAQPPASGLNYIAYVRQNLGLAPAYAQGSYGYQSLSPVIPMWTAFRNITYALFAILLVVAGFLVMFRIKTDPRTVITVQAAIPKVIMALLLVTFSYAIAGFVMDLTYVILFAALGLFRGAGLIGGEVLGVDVIKKALTEWNAAWFGFMVLIFSTGGLFNGINNIVSGFLTPPVIPSIPLISDTLRYVVGIAPSALVLLIILVVIIFVLFKISFLLIKSYISIILAVLIAPFQIMLSSLPGVNGFGSWLKNLVAHAAVFPIVGIMFLVAAILMGPTIGIQIGPVGISFDPFDRTKSGFSTPVAPPPLLGDNLSKPGSIETLIGLGIIFYIPSICSRLQEALRRPLGLESAISMVGFQKSFVGGALYGSAQKKAGDAATTFLGSVPGRIAGKVKEEKGKKAVSPTDQSLAPSTQQTAHHPGWQLPSHRPASGGGAQLAKGQQVSPAPTAGQAATPKKTPRVR